MQYKKNILDTDPQETQDWIDSINALIDEKGTERTHFIIEKLIVEHMCYIIIQNDINHIKDYILTYEK